MYDPVNVGRGVKIWQTNFSAIVNDDFFEIVEGEGLDLQQNQRCCVCLALLQYFW